MRSLPLLACLALLGATLTGCMGWSNTVNLSQVARDTHMVNITTGDGTFANYTAVDHVVSKDIGLAVGIPGIGKFFELVPMRSPEDLLTDAATTARRDGANAMINVKPANEVYWGIPFIFVGLYVDKAEGTGIRVK